MTWTTVSWYVRGNSLFPQYGKTLSPSFALLFKGFRMCFCCTRETENSRSLVSFTILNYSLRSLITFQKKKTGRFIFSLVTQYTFPFFTAANEWQLEKHQVSPEQDNYLKIKYWTSRNIHITTNLCKLTSTPTSHILVIISF